MNVPIEKFLKSLSTSEIVTNIEKMPSYARNSLSCVPRVGSGKMSCNRSNTRNSVSSGYPNTEKRVLAPEIRGVCIADEKLSRVFDMSSQSKQKLRSNRRTKIVKIYAN